MKASTIHSLARSGVTTFSSLRNRDYRHLWLSSVASFAVLNMQILAQGWLVYEMTSSPLALGLATAAWGLPMLLFSLVSGAIADRAQKRGLLTVSQLAIAGTSLAIALLITFDRIEVWHLLIAAFLNGLGLALYAPGRWAMVSDLVEPGGLVNAVALMSVASNLMRLLAPAVAGALLVVIHADGVYYVTSALSIASAIFSSMLPGSISAASTARTQSVGEDIREGIAYIRANSTVKALLGLAVIPVLLAMPYIYLLPTFTVDVLHAGEKELGWLSSAVGAGALFGALTVASLGSTRRKGALMLGAALAFGIVLTLFSLSSSLVLSLALLVAVGGSSMGYIAINMALLQTHSAPEFRGRVMSIFVATFGIERIGTLPIGALAELVGAPVAIGAGGLASALFTGFIALRYRSLRAIS